MAANRNRRKQERARATAPPPDPARPAAAAAQQMTAQVAAAAARAAAPHLPAPSTTADRTPASPSAPAAPADAVRTLALNIMQRSTLHGRHECRPGCAYCCHTAVTVAPPEVFAIARHLLDTLSSFELAALRTRLDENAARAADQTREAYIAALIPCALLTPDGNCRAHAVRPLACAGFLSTSRAACESEFRHQPGRSPLPIDRFAMLVCLSAAHGLRDACQTANLDSRSYELHHALRRAFDTPDAAERWSRGEPIFADCLT